MAKNDEPVDPDYEAPVLEALGTVEDFTEGTDISVVVELP